MTNAKLAHVERVLSDAGSSSATSIVAASWRRSLHKHQLDPASRRGRSRLEERLLNVRTTKNRVLLKAAKKPIEQLLHLVSRSGFGVFLADATGVILDVQCVGNDADFFKKTGLWSGADWSEACEGTNGIGTCIVEQRPIVIHRDHHFFACHTSLTCIGAPIFSPNGEILGVLDVSTVKLDHDLRFNELIGASVKQTAQNIEAEIFRLAFPKHRIILADPLGQESSALFAVDDDDLIVGATRAARRLSLLPSSGCFDAIPYADFCGHRNDQSKLRDFERGERSAIVCALSRTNGNISKAAKGLGIGRATLYRRMRKLELNHAG